MMFVAFRVEPSNALPVGVVESLTSWTQNGGL